MDMRLKLKSVFLFLISISCVVYIVYSLLFSESTNSTQSSDWEALPIVTPKVVAFEVEYEGSSEFEYPWWEIGGHSCNYFLNSDVEVDVSNVSGHCGLRASRAGQIQNVVSYAFFGKNVKYLEKMDILLENVHRMYPEWEVRLHIDPRQHQYTLCPLIERHRYFYICDVTNLPGLGDLSHIQPLLWRFIPVGDPQVLTFLVRDLETMVRYRINL